MGGGGREEGGRGLFEGGAYLLFLLRGWVLIRGGRLLEYGRLFEGIRYAFQDQSEITFLNFSIVFIDF